jgi:Ca-activated chloride channel family protein
VTGTVLGMTLLEPARLALLAALPIGWFIRRRFGSRGVPFAGAAALLAADPGGLGRIRSWRLRTRWVPDGLRVAALALIALAAAMPGRLVPLPRTSEGIDLVLVMDLSSSMTARDLDGQRSRLEAAQEAATAFIAARPEDRLGLVTYARYPELRCPLTRDHGALRAMIAELAAVEPDGPEDATGIGAALAMAVRALRAAESPSRVVVLLSDGAENVAQAEAPREITPDRAAALAQEWKTRVMTLVVGKGAPNAAGEFVPLDTSGLRRVADSTGGRFFVAEDAVALTEAYREIDRLERSPMQEPRFRFEAWTLGFVLGALLLSAAARCGSATLWETWP